jgi:rhodanese-related sulfurtransferase
MRRISWVVAVTAAMAAGCSGGAGSSAAAGQRRGVGDGTFTVTVQNTAPLDIKGGRVTSSPAGIDCGVGGLAGGCAASFPLGTTVVLTAQATGISADKDANGVALPYRFFGWAGDCSGEGACTLSGNADKYVVATFAGRRTGHPNYSMGAVHGPAFTSPSPDRLDCYACHGTNLRGSGIAVGCDLCHELKTVDGVVLPGAVKRLAVAQPTIGFVPPPPLTAAIGQAVPLSALATDPAGATVTCTWSIAARPAGSAVALATTGTCSGAPLLASLTPDVAGTYVVRVTPSNQSASAEATLLVAAQQFAGGAAGLGTATPDAELLAIGAKLREVHAVNTWMTSANLAKSLLGLDAANPKGTYVLVDIRDPEDFARSHAVGAVNVPFAQLPAVLLANPSFPETGTPAKKVAVLGYYGGDGIQASLLVNAARMGAGTTLAANVRAFGVQFGQTSWSFDKGGAPCRYDDDLNVRRLELVPEPQAAWPTTTNVSWLVKPPGGTTYAAPAATNAYPSIAAFTGDPSVTQKILLRAQEYLRWLEEDAAADGTPRQERFQADWVRYDAAVQAGSAPQILSVQSPAQWANGHAKGAILTTAGAVGGLEATAAGANWTALRRIDPTREVWVHCFTGTSAAAPTAILGILGYKARNILYGNAGNTRDTTTGANAALFDYDTTAFANDFPLASGAAPGCDLLGAAASCAAYAPSRSGCRECHASYAAHFAEVTLKPIPGITVEVASEGEG